MVYVHSGLTDGLLYGDNAPIFLKGAQCPWSMLHFFSGKAFGL